MKWILLLALVLPAALTSVVLGDDCVVAPSGLVSWWRGEGNAADSQGSNHGSLQGGVNFAPGKVGSGFLLDGVNDFILVPDSPSLRFTEALTVELWFKSTISGAPGTYIGGLIDKRGGGLVNYGVFVSTDVELYYDDPGVHGGDVPSNFEISSFQPVPSIQVFHHLAGTYRQLAGNQIELKTYIDGQLVRSSTFGGNLANTINTTPVTIGGVSGSCCFFKGIIDEVSIYDRALSSSEVQSIFQAGTAGKCAPGNVPFIASQPSSQTVTVGADVTFSVTVSGNGPFGYQWRHENVDIPGATQTSLTLSNVQSVDTGGYSVQVTNSSGSMTSSVATLTVVLASAPTGFVVPDELRDGDASFGAGTLANPNSRSQQVYMAGEFGSVTGALIITEIRFRPDRQYGGAFNVTIPSFQVNLSTTHKVAEGLSANFNDNIGTNDTIVFSGPLAIQSAFSGPANGPKDFDIRIPLSSFFIYDPADGNLLVDIRNASGSTGTHVAGQGVDGDGASRVTGGLGAASGSADNGADALMIIMAAPVTGTNLPPVILAQPQSRSVLEDASTSFSVLVSGSPELSYQWLHNDKALPDATNSILTLPNTALADAGPYYVIITNSFGSVTSSVAMLTVTQPPASVRAVGGDAASGGTVSVPVQLRANGNENAIGFSLSFNTNFLTLSDVVLGAGAPGGTALFVNTNEIASGRVGLGIALPAEATLVHGTQTVVVVTFHVAPVFNQVTTTINFTDQPTLRQLSDTHAHVLPVTFASASIAIADAEIEGDLAPRPDGNGGVAITDWVQMGRFVALLDTIGGSNEFQRADCAPRATKGNGIIGASDWVQVGRYAVGLDPLTIAGGPIEQDTNGGGAFAPASSGTILSVSNSRIPQGQTNVVPILIDCQGSENAMTFSVDFDATKLAFVGALPGSAASNATLNQNTNQIGAGRIGIALALQPGTSLSAGSREVVLLRFAALAAAPASITVKFTNAPLRLEVSDAFANPVITSYTAGTVSVTPPPGPPLHITRSGGLAYITWSSIGATGFGLQATAGSLSTNWSPITDIIDLGGGQKMAIVPITGGERYFRLKQP